MNLVCCTLSVMAMLNPNKVSLEMEAPPQVLHLTIKTFNYILLNQDDSCWLSTMIYYSNILL